MAKKKILLIEDSKTDADAAKALLEKEGMMNLFNNVEMPLMEVLMEIDSVNNALLSILALSRE